MLTRQKQQQWCEGNVVAFPVRGNLSYIERKRLILGLPPCAFSHLCMPRLKDSPFASECKHAAVCRQEADLVMYTEE